MALEAAEFNDPVKFKRGRVYPALVGYSGKGAEMTIDYETFKPHPTVYKGIRFRSRLEATWAAFFDKLEWQWEYEPFDLGSWSPDFLIKGATRDALVEVKPISKFDEGPR